MQQRKVSLILLNGVVYTVDDANSVAEAIAIRENEIAAVGTTEEIRSHFEADTVIDLKGKAVYPGFTDAHAHFEGLGALLSNLNLEGTTSVEQIRTKVAEWAATLPEGMWLRGRSWDQNDWETKSFPIHQMLDDVAGDHPAYLKRIDGHALWVNKKALDLAGVTKATAEPPGGMIMRDADGNPTGVLIDNAIDLIDSVMPAPSVEERTRAVESAVQECLRVGLTEVHDMGVDKELIDIYKKLIEQSRFPFRIYAAIGGTGKDWQEYLRSGPDIGQNDERLTVRALKLYVDGALGSRGAALIEPYTDDPGNRGLTLTSSEALRTASAQALDKGFQVCVHAIGDRANHIALNIFEDVFKANRIKADGARFRVEHVQVLDELDIPRFAKANVIPSMQPTHCTSDMYWAEDRLGPTRVKFAYAWRSLLNTGCIIPGGSDFPVERPDPLRGFYAAITRQDEANWPNGGWYPDQRMTREEALKAFTTWAAYAAFEERRRGSIEVGKLADIVVLSNDIMKCDVSEILKVRVLHTIVGGEVAYSATEGMSAR
ncbi:MAG: amidohydrolase [Ignavibacteriae bacterium]|nr:amidohydrolase [Ignavibacteriota bacterium]